MSTPAWLDRGYAELRRGVAEMPGGDHNERILQYHATTSLKATEDETPWCSSFVNWCVEHSGYTGTSSARARSWLFWGRDIPTPREGCIVVMQRGAGAQPGPSVLEAPGHVGIFVGYSVEPGRGGLILLGGNQGNRVSLRSYSVGRVLGLRWPDEEE